MLAHHAQGVVNERCIEIIEEIANENIHTASSELVISIMLQRFGVPHFDSLCVGPPSCIPVLSWLYDINSKIEACITSHIAIQPILSLKDVEYSVTAVLNSFLFPTLRNFKPEWQQRAVFDPNEISLEDVDVGDSAAEELTPCSFVDYGIGQLVYHPRLAQIFPLIYHSTRQGLEIPILMSSTDVLYHLGSICDHLPLKSLDAHRIEEALFPELGISSLQEVGVQLSPHLDFALELSMLQHVRSVRMKAVAEAQQKILDSVYAQHHSADNEYEDSPIINETSSAYDGITSFPADMSRRSVLSQAQSVVVPKLAPPSKASIAKFLTECSLQLKLNETPYSPSYQKVQTALLAVIARSDNRSSRNSSSRSTCTRKQNRDSEEHDEGEQHTEEQTDELDYSESSTSKKRKRRRNKRNNSESCDTSTDINKNNVVVNNKINGDTASGSLNGHHRPSINNSDNSSDNSSLLHRNNSSEDQQLESETGTRIAEDQRLPVLLLEIAADYLMLHFGGTKFRKKRWVLEQEQVDNSNDGDDDNNDSAGDNNVDVGDDGRKYVGDNDDDGNVGGVDHGDTNASSSMHKQRESSSGEEEAGEEVEEERGEEGREVESSKCSATATATEKEEESRPVNGTASVTAPTSSTMTTMIMARIVDHQSESEEEKLSSSSAAGGSNIQLQHSSPDQSTNYLTTASCPQHTDTTTDTTAMATAGAAAFTTDTTKHNNQLKQPHVSSNDATESGKIVAPAAPANFESKIYSSFLRDPASLTYETGVRIIQNRELQSICPWVGDLDLKDTRAVGRWGEALVYHFIGMSLGTKQSSQSFQQGAGAGAKKGLSIVEWVNEKEETKACYDIIVRCTASSTAAAAAAAVSASARHSESSSSRTHIHTSRAAAAIAPVVTTTTYVEVKTSRFEDLNVFELSLWEWQFATDNPRVRYHIYRVFNAGDPQKVRIVIIEDVLQMIQERRVKLCIAV